MKLVIMSFALLTALQANANTNGHQVCGVPQKSNCTRGVVEYCGFTISNKVFNVNADSDNGKALNEAVEKNAAVIVTYNKNDTITSISELNGSICPK